MGDAASYASPLSSEDAALDRGGRGGDVSDNGNGGNRTVSESGYCSVDARATQFVNRLVAESLLYPLLCVANRVIAYTAPDPVGTLDMCVLTYRYDGVAGYFGGLGAHLLAVACEEAADVLLWRYCRDRQKPAQDYAALRGILLANFQSLLAPLVDLSTVQRCQSVLPGLCAPLSAIEVLRTMSWKAIASNALLSAAAFSFNLAALASGPPSQSVPSS
eukprot:GHVU01194535.1.p1 GENE.GHVU01194535.1~~GHVU01194535.1.p1  ORF type:complete len:218 (+),score=27.68 GHVU01194535.1:757-1410(+)